MKIVMIGPSGSGKGSLAEFLTKHYEVPHISTGDLFRQNKEIKEKYVDQGIFVPDEVTVKMVIERIARPDCKKGFILDGFPRTLNQAQLLDKSVKIDQVVETDSSDETVHVRLGGRYTCRKCNTIHNTRNEDVSKCRSCKSADMYQRDDDKTEKIQKRLDQYRVGARPLLDFYRKKGIVVVVTSELKDKPADMYAKYLKMIKK